MTEVYLVSYDPILNNQVYKKPRYDNPNLMELEVVTLHQHFDVSKKEVYDEIKKNSDSLLKKIRNEDDTSKLKLNDLEQSIANLPPKIRISICAREKSIKEKLGRLTRSEFDLPNLAKEQYVTISYAVMPIEKILMLEKYDGDIQTYLKSINNEELEDKNLGKKWMLEMKIKYNALIPKWDDIDRFIDWLQGKDREAANFAHREPFVLTGDLSDLTELRQVFYSVSAGLKSLNHLSLLKDVSDVKKHYEAINAVNMLREEIYLEELENKDKFKTPHDFSDLQNEKIEKMRLH